MVWSFDEDEQQTGKEGIAAQDDREKEKRTPEENMGKFNDGHFERKKCYME